MVQSYLLLGALGVHSIEDIRQKKITAVITLIFSIIGILLQVWNGDHSVVQILSGMALGVCIMGFSYLTKGKIGIGDGMILVMTGIYLGIVDNLRLLSISFFLAGIWGILLLVLGFDKQTKIPFVPFLFFGELLMVIGGMG